MDIEYSPGAPVQRNGAAAREIGAFDSDEGGMNGKRLCSKGHPAAVQGKRAGRTVSERTLGVLWRHSSVNLVGPRSIALAGPEFSPTTAGDHYAVSIPESPPQPRNSRSTALFIPKNVRISCLCPAKAISH
jgi:hypothetical protein